MLDSRQNIFGANLKRLCMAVGLLFLLAPADAVQPADGFFYGVEMEPIGNATITTVETEPAVVLLFRTDQQTADVTRQFEVWYAGPNRPDINAFAIGVGPEDLSSDVVLEAINQRGLSMPVFLAGADLLLGDDFRLLLLNDDMEIQRFTTVDIPALHTAIAGLGIAVPDTAQVTPGTAPTPDTSVSVDVDRDSGTLPDGSAYSRVTTTTRTESTEVAVVQGGKSRDNIYVNQLYGMQVEFPPLWQYQVSASDDGAVALEPSSSKMDMRVWAAPDEGIAEPQKYIDDRLDDLASKYSTRVNVERRFIVRDDGEEGYDITYAYTRPIDADVPARGGLLYRGRIQVFVHEGYIKAASIEAPSGEFTAVFPMIESFFRSFEIKSGDIGADPRYNSPIL